MEVLLFIATQFYDAIGYLKKEALQKQKPQIIR